MKEYRHREDGFKIEAEYSNLDYRYLVHSGYPTSTQAFYLTVKDFNRLFEPVPEYCCDWFRKCVERKVIRRSTIQTAASANEWAWDTLGEWFTECPFCKTKL